MAKTKNKTLKTTGKPYKGSNSASVIDNVKVYGNKNTVRVLNGNDVVTVYKGGSHKIYGGDGKDRISITKDAGENIFVNGGKGVDTITISGGGSYSNHEIHGDAGNDNITVAKDGNAMRSNIYGDAGDDIIKVNGGVQHKIYGGGGADTIRINGGGGHTVDTGGSKGTKKYDRVYIGKDYSSSVTVNGGAEKDYIEILGGTGHVINTNGGNDVIKIGSAKNRITTARYKIDTGAGNDEVTATNLVTINVNDGAGNDKINISNAGSAEINVGAGKNKINLSDINYANIYTSGEKATNTIKLSGGDYNYVNGYSNGKTESKNIITIDGGNNHSIQGNPGSDTITVNGGSGHKILIGFRNEFGDTVTVNGGKDISVELSSDTSNNKAILKGGSTTLNLWNKSSDTIHVYFSGKEKNSVAINYQSYNGVGYSGGVYSAGDSTHKKLILHGLTNYSVNFDKDDSKSSGGILEITCNGSTLTMDHWRCVTGIYDISVAGTDGKTNPWADQSKYV